MGPTGIGKTTFSRPSRVRRPPQCINAYGSGVPPGYLSQEQELLDPGLTALETIQQVPGMVNHTESRTFLHRFLFKGDEFFQSVETSPLRPTLPADAGLLEAQHCNFLLLDSPLNPLDLPSKEALETAEHFGVTSSDAHDHYSTTARPGGLEFTPTGSEPQLTMAQSKDMEA